MLRIINILTYALIAWIAAFSMDLLAQSKPLQLTEKSEENITMTWNATTPESEMKDDIKALAEKGITIKYSNIKRNSKDQIVGIKVEYSDRKGNKGSLELNNQKPINTIRFYQQGDEVGFGTPSNANVFAFAGNDFFEGNSQDIMKHFGGTGAQSFNFSFPEGIEFGDTTRIVIKQDGKKPLVIENGEIIEGGDDYTKEELDEIKKNNKSGFIKGFGSNFNNQEFDFRSQEGLDNFKKQMEKLHIDIEKTRPDADKGELTKEELDKTKEEMIKAKEEMIQAKKEMEQAKKELQQAQATKKTQKS